MASNKLLIWMNMPSHHQSAFFQALRDAGVDLVVRYYSKVYQKRLNLGWEHTAHLFPGEQYVRADLSALSSCIDWRQRTHIIPGYGHKFLRQLVKKFSRNNVPWVHWSEPSHPGLSWWLSYPRKRLHARLVNGHAVVALAIGDLAYRDFVRWGINRNKIDFLPYAVDGLLDTGDRDETLFKFCQRFEIIFLYVGTLCHRKGTDLLIRAFGQLVRRFPSVGLALVGKNTGKQDYRFLAKRYVPAKNIHFHGPVLSSRVTSVYSTGSVVILPSRFDGWGMALNEAASLGKALIATDRCGAAHHLIKDGENGYVISANSVVELTKKMEHYARDPFLAHTHGVRSLEIFSHFTPQKNAERLVAIMDKASMTPASYSPLQI